MTALLLALQMAALPAPQLEAGRQPADRASNAAEHAIVAFLTEWAEAWQRTEAGKLMRELRAPAKRSPRDVRLTGQPGERLVPADHLDDQPRRRQGDQRAHLRRALNRACASRTNAASCPGQLLAQAG